MPYKIKSIHYTLQGEGANAGRACVMVRFSGCNLWSGREDDRSTAVCRFCDTDFIGGTVYADAIDLEREAEKHWPGSPLCKPAALVVLTGGEPALQVDQALVSAFRSRGWEVAIETNGTRELPSGIHWITVSPKAGTHLVATQGNELKIVYPQDGIDPKQHEHMLFGHFFIQPMDGSNYAENLKAAADYCLKNPKWRLSIQTHKLVGLP